MNIIVHQIDNISVGIDKKNGYLNATKLCAAYSLAKNVLKRPNDWLKTDRAKSYIAYVASITNISVELLVVAKAGNSDESGTWIHPDLGTAFATWLSFEYEYSVTKWIQEWRSGKSSKEFPKQLTGDVAPNPTKELAEKVSVTIDILFAHIDIELRTGMKIEGMCAVDPSFKPILEPFKPKLILDAPLLSPTEIGKLLEASDGIKRSGIAINKLLIERSLQVATGDKKLTYRAIGQGIEFSKVVADTASGHGKTIQSLRWYESVVDLLLGANVNA
jgi:hypothetical protein